MRLLFPWLVLAAISGCTRSNPVFGEGETDPSDSGKDTGSDPTGNPTSDSMSSSAETGTASQSTTQSDSSPDSTLSSADTLEPPEDCCTHHDTPGCDDPTVKECVCAVIESCCSELWADKCVEEARHCGGECPNATTGIASESLTDTMTGGTTTDGGSSTTANDGGGSSTGTVSDCCVAADAMGCPSDETIETCVCGEHPECCRQTWTETCVGYAVDCGLAC